MRCHHWVCLRPAIGCGPTADQPASEHGATPTSSHAGRMVTSFQNNNVQSCSLTEFTNVAIPLKMRMMHSGLEEAQSLLLVMAFCQRLGDVHCGQSRQGCTEGMFVSRRRGNRRCTKARVRRLIGASLYAKAPVMHPDAAATGFGTGAVLRLWRIAIFRTGFPSGLD